MSIPKTVIVALFLIAIATLLDYLMPYKPTLLSGGGRIGAFFIMLQGIVLLILGTAVKAFEPQKKEWLVGSLAAVVVLGVAWLNGWIFAFAHA